MDALSLVEAQVLLTSSVGEDQQKASQHDGNYSKPNPNTRWRSNKSQNFEEESQIDVSKSEAQDQLVNSFTTERQQKGDTMKTNPTTLTLLKHAKITCAAMTITWISAAWFFLEPILAKRLTHFDLGKRGIGIMFALSNLVYVPTAFCIQFIPKRIIPKHAVIATSILLTPIAVLLVGSNSFTFITLGILLLGLFPTPVWIMLLPSMQEDASNLFPYQDQKRCVNDLTAGVYNLFITLGQIVGYIIGPLVNQSYGVVMTTRLVAGFIFVQLIVYFVGVGMCGGRLRWQRKARRKGRYFVRYT
jgi:predicted MFS family arabinose efflux permease